MTTKLDRWFKDAAKEDLWRTAFTLIAKNYYVEVNTERRSNDSDSISHDGWLECSIKQWKDLFMVQSIQPIYIGFRSFT